MLPLNNSLLLESLEQNFVSVLIATVLLLLRRNSDCDLGRVLVVAKNAVQAISVNRILRLLVSLAHQIIKQLLGQVLLTFVR